MLTEKTEAHIVEIGEDETLTAVDGDISVPLVDPIFDDLYDHNMHYATSLDNDTSRMYEWLAVSGSTCHIARTRELFSTYEATRDATAIGVGGTQTKIEGRGTVILTAWLGIRPNPYALNFSTTLPQSLMRAIGRWAVQITLQLFLRTNIIYHLWDDGK